MECCALCPKPRAMWKLLYLTSCGHFSLKLLKREGQFQLAVGNTEKGLLVISSTSPGMTFRYPLSPLCSLHCFWLSIFVVISNSVSLEKPPLQVSFLVPTIYRELCIHGFKPQLVVSGQSYLFDIKVKSHKISAFKKLTVHVTIKTTWSFTRKKLFKSVQMNSNASITAHKVIIIII